MWCPAMTSSPAMISDRAILQEGYQRPFQAVMSGLCGLCRTQVDCDHRATAFPVCEFKMSAMGKRDGLHHR